MLARLSFVGFCAVISVLLTSCATLSGISFDISDIRVEHKLNGYLVELVTGHPIGDVAAIISKDDWLMITIVGSTVDFDRLRAVPSNDLFSECEVVGTRTSVQLTIKLKQKFRSCDVVRDPDDKSVSIALYSQ